MFPERFSEIDDLTRLDHPYLNINDSCLYLVEYMAGAGYTHSHTNQLIFNLKKSVTKKGNDEYRYKLIAINNAGIALRKAFGDDGWLQRVPCFVPIPPSKSKDHPEYDDRLLRVLDKMADGLKVDIREIVLQRKSTEAAHEGDRRPAPDELAQNYYIDRDKVNPTPGLLIVVDDVLTKGAHFKAMKSVLEPVYLQTQIIGIFLARSIHRNV